MTANMDWEKTHSREIFKQARYNRAGLGGHSVK
jgi:hypothetical protein